MTTDNNGARVRRRQDVLWRRSSDIVLVLTSGCAEPLALSPAATALWDVVADWCAVGDAAHVLGVDPASDLVPALDALAAADVVEFEP